MRTLRASDGDHKMESVVHYLGELGAELMVGVGHGDDVVRVADDHVLLLVALAREADDVAAAAGMDLDAFVLQALREARTRTPRHETRRREAQPTGPV